MVVQDVNDEASQLAEGAARHIVIIQHKKITRRCQPLDHTCQPVRVGDDAQHGVQVAAQQIDVAGGDGGVRDLPGQEEVLFADVLRVFVDERAEQAGLADRNVLHRIHAEPITITQRHPIHVDVGQRLDHLVAGQVHVLEVKEVAAPEFDVCALGVLPVGYTPMADRAGAGVEIWVLKLSGPDPILERGRLVDALPRA